MNIYEESYKDLTVKKEGHLLWIGFNNPSQKNAITIPMIHSMEKVLSHADFDSEIRVIILFGEGDSFCSGGDLKGMKNKTGMFAGDPNQLRLIYEDGIQRIPRLLERIQTPLIAMVNGAAIGAGCDFSCMCDLRIGSEKTKIGETFTKLALIPGDGGCFFLPRVVGYAKAVEMTLTGRVYRAKECLDMGLLNELCDPAKIVERTKEVAQEIAGNSPIAVSMAKKALKASRTMELNQVLDQLASFQAITQRTNDHDEAVNAFLEKRSPDFKGK